jgi:signal transduction histidine kinase
MPQKLRALRVTVDHVAQEVHQLAYELRPVTLDELGLVGALSGYLDAWSNRTGLPVDFVTSGMDESRLPAPIETTLYRIVQEAMNNVYKHASAHTVSVTVERRSGHVLAIVEDDGSGFDASRLDATSTRQIGIVGMRERALVVGGELTLESSEGHGTTLRVKLPLPLQ